MSFFEGMDYNDKINANYEGDNVNAEGGFLRFK